jgi:alkaline phosphatase
MRVDFFRTTGLNVKMVRIVLLLLLVVDLAAASPKPPRGIVLIISDGTSQELLTAARCYAGGCGGRLVMDDYPATAFVSTYSASDMVTDSAAGATAFARGIKADNRVVGMASPNSTNAPPSLLELARKAGWSTGTITDDSVTGATPSPFEVECRDRDLHAEIARKIVMQMGGGVDLVLGGGNKWFHDTSMTESYAPGILPEVQQTEAILREKPVLAFSRWEDFQSHVKGGQGLKKAVLGTFFPDVFPYYADGTRTLRLRDMVDEGLELLLRDKRPFFLMVEAGLPDKACHQNQARRAITEVLELDAMMELLKAKLPPEVLVVATTDHNCGGFAFNGPVPLRLRGESFLAENPLSKSSIFTWATGPGGPGGGDAKPAQREAVDDFLSVEHVQPAAVHDGGAHHTGGDVWLVAQGPGAEKFHGHIDNTQIYTLLAKVINGGGNR